MNNKSEKNQRNAGFKKTADFISNDRFCEEEASDNNSTLYRFTNYIEKVVIHARIDYLRHQQFISKHEELTDEIQDTSGERLFVTQDDEVLIEALKVTTLEEVATGEKLFNAIRVLSFIEKEVLFHIFVEERTPKETAILMKISLSWALRIKKRALNKLYRAMTEKGEF